MIKQRNFYYDNARFLIVLLVVFVHSISPDRGEISKGVYLNPLTRNDFFISLSALIQLFIMPSIFIISGYFFKKEITTKYVKSILQTLIIPLVVFEIIFKIATPPDLNPTELFTEPFYILWFLGVIISYKFLSPYLYRFNLYTVLFFLIVLSLTPHFEIISLQWGGDNLIKYSPYYIIGMLFKTNKFDISNISFKKYQKYLSFFCFFIIFIALYYFKVDFNEVLPEGDDEGYTIGIRLIIQKYSVLKSLTIDIIYRFLTIVLCICFFAIVPKKERIFTNYGHYTMYPYILHIFVIYFFLDKWLKIYSHQPTEWWFYIILVGFSVATMVVLSSKYVRKITKPIISPNLDILFKVIFNNREKN